jgi:hypothetical protein
MGLLLEFRKFAGILRCGPSEVKPIAKLLTAA